MRVCVVGGGVIGLSSALYLKQQQGGMDVTVLTLATTPDTTADGAAGIWSPYLLGNTPADKQYRWAKETHDLAESLWNSAIGGIVGISLVSTTRLNLDLKQQPEWKEIVHGFRTLSEKELEAIGRRKGKHRLGYEFVTYAIEPVRLLPYLLHQFTSLGGEMVTGVKVTDLTSLDFDLVVNCSGVWAGELASDPAVSPLRGQVVRVRAPWIHRCILDDEDDGNYVIPNQDSVVLGGTHQQGDWSTTPTDEDRAFIMEGSECLMPAALKGADFIRDWVGLRPGRHSVRLERETVQRGNRRVEVIHNYGHGGSGITTFWGCAKEVYLLAEEVRKEMMTKQQQRWLPMSKL